MRLKIPLSSRGLKLSNNKPGCRASALLSFVYSYHLIQKSDSFSFSFQDQFLFLCWKINLGPWSMVGCWNCHVTRGHLKNGHLHIYSLWLRRALSYQVFLVGRCSRMTRGARLADRTHSHAWFGLDGFAASPGWNPWRGTRGRDAEKAVPTPESLHCSFLVFVPFLLLILKQRHVFDEIRREQWQLYLELFISLFFSLFDNRYDAWQATRLYCITSILANTLDF
jgi:hypothetical protein